MKDPSIVQVQKELEQFCKNIPDTSNIEKRRKYQDSRKQYKKMIKEQENLFYRNTLS